MPWLSIIIPAYNAGRYIHECFQSIMSNDCQGVEIVVVDDGSTDDTGTLCDNFALEHSILRVIHEENQGSSIARITGLENAIGDWVWFVDADDVVAANALSYLHTALRNMAGDVCNVGYEFFADKNGETDYPIAVPAKPRQLTSEDFLRGLYRGSFEHFLPTYLFRRSLLLQLQRKAGDNPDKAFPLIRGLSLYEDLVGIEGLLRVIPFVNVIDAPYYGMRQNFTSMTHRQSTASALSGLKAVKVISKYSVSLGSECDKARMELALLFSAYKLLEPQSRKIYRDQFRKEISRRVKYLGIARLGRHCLIRYILFITRLMDVIIAVRNR